MYKSHLVLQFEVLHEGSSFIASFVEDSLIVFSVYKMPDSSFFNFDLLELIQSAFVKIFFFSLKF